MHASKPILQILDKDHGFNLVWHWGLEVCCSDCDNIPGRKQEDKIVRSECAYHTEGLPLISGRSMWVISRTFNHSTHHTYHICFSLMSTCQSFILSLSVQLNLIMRWWWEFPNEQIYALSEVDGFVAMILSCKARAGTPLRFVYT